MAEKSRPKHVAKHLYSHPSVSNSGGGGAGRSDDNYDVHKSLDEFWERQMERLERMTQADFRETKVGQELPLARIKKIMKLDDDVKSQMISAEAPCLFAKACEMFIEELTIRAWIHTEDNKRKTLQKNDIAMAISKNDMFDFLIDIVPREEIVKSSGGGGASMSPGGGKRGVNNSPVNTSVESHLPMFVQMATPAPGIVAQSAVQSIPVQLPNGQIVQAQTLGSQSLQLVQGANGELQLVNVAATPQPTQILHAAPISHQTQHQHETSGGQPSSPTTFAQAFQQIVAPDGTVHHLPIQLSPAQMNYLKQHLNSGGGQQIQIIQNPTSTVGGSIASTSIVRAQSQQQQQQQAFFIQTSAPSGQPQHHGIQLQMIPTSHQASETATTSSS